MYSDVIKFLCFVVAIIVSLAVGIRIGQIDTESKMERVIIINGWGYYTNNINGYPILIYKTNINFSIK